MVKELKLTDGDLRIALEMKWQLYGTEMGAELHWTTRPFRTSQCG